MRVTVYRAELDENKHNILVKERACNCPVESVNTPQSAVEILNIVFHLNKLAEEYVYMAALDGKSHSLGVFEISHGVANRSLCNPREIFIRALLCGAVSIILAHNHPSGDCTPSDDDKETYRRVKEAGHLLGIGLVDNIIVGDGYFSFKEHGI